MSGIQVRLIDVLYVMIKRWKMILVLGAVGLFVGCAISGISYMQTRGSYARIWCNVAITAQGADGKFPESRTIPSSSDYSLSENMADAVTYLFTSDGAKEKMLEAAGLEDDANIEAFDQYLTVSRYGETQVIELELQWNDADQGIQLLKDLIEATEDTMQSTLGFGRLSIIDGPEVSYIAAGETRTFAKNTGTMGTVGTLIGMGIVILDLILRPTLLAPKDIEKILKLETVGIIPKDDAYFQNRTNLLIQEEDDETSTIGQNYASTAYILRNIIGTKSKCNCFYVTSAGDGEGKTTVAANLAIHLSDMGKRVLLVDLDTRKPSLGGLFLNAVDYSRSLNALYKGEATEQEAINSLTGTLDLLPLILERNGIALDDTLLEMIERLSQEYQYVIIDAPSVGKSAEVLGLNRIANMALFVVRHDMTTIEDIQAAIRTIDKSGIRILGCILNAYQAIEWSSFFETAKKKIPGTKKKKRKKMIDKEHTAEINAMVTRDEQYEKEEQKAGIQRRTAVFSDDLLAQVSDDDIDSADEEEQIQTEDALEALVRIGTDSSWKKKKES